MLYVQELDTLVEHEGYEALLCSLPANLFLLLVLRDAKGTWETSSHVIGNQTVSVQEFEQALYQRSDGIH